MTRHVILKGIGLLFIFMLSCIGTNMNYLPSRTAVVFPYFLSTDTTPGNSDPTQDEWPMFRGQLNHTGEAQTTSTARASPFWSNATGGDVSSSPAVVGGRVFVGNMNNKFYCLNVTTGKQLWSYATESQVFSSPAVAGGRVFMGSLDYQIYCLNITSGELLWNYATESYVYSSPAVADGRVFVGSNDFKLYCLNATTGKSLWNYTTGSYVFSSPAVAGGRVFVGSCDSHVYCLNASTGKQLWNYTAGDEVRSSPAVAGGRVFVGSDDRHVYCLNVTTGAQLWNYPTGWGVLSSSAVAGGRVFVGSQDNKVYCLNATTGKQLWNYSTGNIVQSSPAVAGGCVYVGSDKLYCLNVTTGKQLWNYITGSYVYSSPAVTGGRVYVGSGNGKVHCLPTAAAPPTYTTVTESADPLELGCTEGITIYGVAALSGIQTVLIAFEGTNHTMTDLGGGTWSYGTWKPGSSGTYLYTIYMNDTLNHWNATSGSIQVVNFTAPTYTSVMESADPLELGGTETITIFGVRDIAGIQIVRIAFSGLNHTMTNLGGGTFRYNLWTPGSWGNYSYTIYMSDTLNHWNATTGSIQVVDTKPPTFTGVTESADPLELGSMEMITIAGVADLSGIQTVQIAFEGVNHTMTNLGGGIWRYNTWSPSSRGNYSYTIYMSDTLNNCKATIGSIQVVDTKPPTFTGVTESADPLELGSMETITIADVADFSGIQTVLIAFEEANHTMNDLGGGTWRYSTWSPSSRGNYSYTIYMSDTLNHWNATTDSIQVVDTTPPTFTGVTESADPLELGNTETITIYGVADFSGIQTVRIAFEGANHTMTDLGGGTWRYTTWSPGSRGNYSYTIYMSDTLNHWNVTTGSIEVVDTTPPYFIIVMESADPLELGATETIPIAGVADLSGIQTVLLAFEGANHTMTNLGSGVWCYNAWSPGSIGTYSYTIYMQDTAGNWNATSGVIQVNTTSTTPTGLEPLVWVLALIIAGLIAFTIVNHLRLSKKIRKLPAPKAIPPKDLPKNLKSQ